MDSDEERNWVYCGMIKLLGSFLKEKRGDICLYIGFIGVFYVIFSLSNLPVDAVNYAFFLSAIWLLGYGIFKFNQYYKKGVAVIEAKQRLEEVTENLPATRSYIELEYQAIIQNMYKKMSDLQSAERIGRQEMKDYEADGDMLKSALINAQRMGENVIREANQKAEEILHRANLRGDDVIRDANELLQKASDRADEIINEANEKKLAEEREYDRVRLEVTRFKSDVLNLYRSHVESLSRLPEFQKEEAPAEEPEESAAEDEVEETTAELNEKLDNAADAKAPETAEADDTAEDGDAEKSEDFWEKDESQLKLDPPPADAAPTAPDYAAFQGVKFSE